MVAHPENESAKLIGELAEIGRLAERDIDLDSSLASDLGLDSVAVAEVAVLLVEEYDVDPGKVDMDGNNWSAMTVRRLLDDYIRHQPRRGFPRP